MTVLDSATALAVLQGIGKKTQKKDIGSENHPGIGSDWPVPRLGWPVIGSGTTWAGPRFHILRINTFGLILGSKVGIDSP